MKLIDTTPEADSLHVNTPAFDRYTFAHVGMGFILGSVRATLPGAVIAAVGWEVFEYSAKKYFAKSYPTVFGDESVQNMAIDVITVIAGWGIVKLYENSLKKGE